MRYGFIIDNRKCIGCHACTVACKSEHQVPVGVYRTWVKYIEKGEFPNSRRYFTVLRCNHCDDAPCVEICPVQALFVRDDGIVDFDNRRCIGCKSCMQACPYEALYIDPETSTAAKCNYCAHRVEMGLQPACVIVCPEQAIIAGDLDDPNSEIARLLARYPTVVRKPEKDTRPKLFYIEADEASVSPLPVESREDFWTSKDLGVGHYARYAEKLAFDNDNVVSYLEELTRKDAELIEADGTQVSYAAPRQGILWGWEVSGYIWTKAIASGLILLMALMSLMGFDLGFNAEIAGVTGSLAFLGLTTALLIKDLDRPDRFLYVLLRPQWKSWLVRGGYGLVAFGAVLTAMLAIALSGVMSGLYPVAKVVAGTVAVFVAVYTAFLFAQARGRDFWQSPSLIAHMLFNSLLAGAAVWLLLGLWMPMADQTINFLRTLLMVTIVLSVFNMLIDLAFPHPTADAKRTVEMIRSGRYSRLFWIGVLLIGHVLPFVVLWWYGIEPVGLLLSAVGVLIGVYLSDKIWVEAPQRIPLS